MVIHQLVERVELHHPQEILSSTVTKNFEMLDVISKPVGHKGENYEQDIHRTSQTVECEVVEILDALGSDP